MSGWIKLHRKIQDNPLWTCEPFTRGQAWVDLILLANHKDSFFYKRNVKVDVLRGQVGRSEVELSDRWKWSRSKVRKYLNDLEKGQQVIQHKTFITQLVTVVNYESYQEKEQQSEQQQDSRKTAEEQQQDTYKNDKKNKEGKEGKETNADFDLFWNLYDKKTGDKNGCIKKWDRLKPETQTKILSILPEWKTQFSDKQFQPYPATFLNQERWNDEIINNNGEKKEPRIVYNPNLKTK